MPIALKYRFLLLLFICIVAAILGTSMMRPDAAQGATKPQNRARRQASASRPASTDSGQDLQNNSQDLDSQDQNEEPADEELAPAAVQLDVSKASPLIDELYQATRETKEKDILARLADAKRLLGNGTDVKATDAQGRTALHWAVFGSSYNTKPSIVVAYEEIANTLIAQGAT
jgi:hypothetical protein